MSAPHHPPADATQRFGNRVDDYIRYRPDYPPAVLDWLAAEFGLSAGQAVADVGSGTGIWTRRLLKRGLEAFAVEPNEPMRAAAERLLGGEPRFHSLAGTAEATGLPDACVDWLTAAQAFHWFDVDRARAEALRVLREPGHVALLWNERRSDTPFLAAYEALILELATDYTKVRHENVHTDDRLERFFGPAERRQAFFPNVQRLDLDGLTGRTLSASYMPARGQPRHEELLERLERLFAEHARGSVVEIVYDTDVIVGRLR